MFGRPKNRRRAKDRTVRRLRIPKINWRRAGLIAVSLAGVLAVAGMVHWALDQPVEAIKLEGRFQRVSPVEVERAVKERLHGVGLVSVDLEELRQGVDNLPWVDVVSVRRAWPRAVHISIQEQVAAARWGERGLINTRGELFAREASHIPPELPQLDGPPGSEKQVAQRYLATQGRLVEAGMRLTALRLDARGAWELELDNGVTVRLGRRQVDERFETFMATAMKLVGQKATDIAYIDMRYTNGFAVGWRGGSAQQLTREDDRRDA